jgi:hypothetical protein
MVDFVLKDASSEVIEFKVEFKRDMEIDWTNPK